jgi:hypothetical protein
MRKQDGESLRPVYIPWKSFDGYAAQLKKVGTVPHTLDNSARPSSMAGGLWRAMVAGLKFLKLIESDGRTKDVLHKLVKAHGTGDWPNAVKQHVVSAYSDIVADLPLENATASQLDAKFRVTKLEGQLLRRAERFYLHALRVAGVKYSSLFAIRRETPGGVKKRVPRNHDDRDDGKGASRSKLRETPNQDDLPAGMIDVPIMISSESCFIRVPLDITTDHMPLVKAAVALIEAKATLNSTAKT